MQVACGTQTGDLHRIHAQAFRNAGRVPTYPQRVSVNIHMLHVDGGGKCFKCAVLEAVHRSQQFQILADALRQTSREIVIVRRERHVVCEEAQRFQVLGAVRTFRGSAPQRDQAHQFPPDAQRGQTPEHFRGDVSVLTQERIVIAPLQQNRLSCGEQTVRMTG